MPASTSLISSALAFLGFQSQQQPIITQANQAGRILADTLQSAYPEEEAAEYSGYQRHLLQTSTNVSAPVTYINQYCYPTGSCSLSSLSNGFAGFTLEGEGVNDYSGSSVSTTGDFNGNGVAGVIVGAFGAGKSYVLFGSKNQATWSAGTLNLGSFIDGQHGVVLTGAPGDQSGISVSGTGDINGDGRPDLLIGASAARAAAGDISVVFDPKNSSAWTSGIFNLSSLNGSNGFVLRGGMIGDSSGYSVSSGDINGDGVSDIVIGAPYADSPAGTLDVGKVYVVFGSSDPDVWGSGIFNLDGLDGQSGFVVLGEKNDDRLGFSVSTVDINDDGYSDLLMGALYGDSPGKTDNGKTYVVFGTNGTAAWGSGILNVSDLIINGQRGFILHGEADGDRSGFSVGSAGDVNGDGVSDILITAPFATVLGNPNAGKTYVIFGSNNTNATVWGSGTLNIIDLMNGQRGFMLRGEVTGAGCNGRAVTASGGDINGDDLSDIIIGAYGIDVSGKTGAGKSYVIFGSRKRATWGSGILDVSSMADGHFGFALEGDAFDYSGTPLNILPDINGDGLSDIFVGGYQAVASGKLNAGKNHFVFGPSLDFYFTANHLSTAVGQTVSLNSQFLAVANNHPDININASRVTMQNIENCYFTSINAPTTTLTTCSMQDINDGLIRVTHTGNTLPPKYRVTVGLPPVLLINSIYSDVEVNFLGYLPSQTINRLSINQNETVRLQVSDLNANDQDDVASAILFRITNVKHGQFNLYDSTHALAASNITQFTLQQILDGRVGFAHDGSRVQPSYSVAVTDGKSTTQSQAAIVTFNSPPILSITSSPIIFDEGRSTTLSPQMISAIDAETFSDSLFIEVANISEGNFSYVNNPQIAITTQFGQSLLPTGAVQFSPNNSVTPSFALRASDGLLYSPWQVPRFYLNHKPQVQGRAIDQSFIQGDDFSFALDIKFSDSDNDTLTYYAQLKGSGAAGGSLPPGVTFASPRYFFGNLLSVNTYNIEVGARDPRGLTVTTDFILSSSESKEAYYRAVYSSLSGVGGAILTIATYILVRTWIAQHRRDFPLANNLRKILNLQYYDFSRFDGDSYKTKVNDFLQQLELTYPKIYTTLSASEQKSFAICFAEILIAHDLVSSSSYGRGWFGMLCCLNIGFPSQLNLRKFEQEREEIIEESVAAWKKGVGYKLRPLSDLSEDRENDTIYVEMKGSTIHYTVMDQGVKEGGEQGTIEAKEINLKVHPDYEIRPLSDLPTDNPPDPDAIYIGIQGNTIHYAVMSDQNVGEGNKERVMEEGTIEAKDISLDVLPHTVAGLKPHLPAILEITLRNGHTRPQINTVDELESYLPAILQITLARKHTRSQADKANRLWAYHPHSLREKFSIFFRCSKPPTRTFIEDRQHMHRDNDDVELDTLNHYAQSRAPRTRLDRLETRLGFLEEQAKNRGKERGTSDETRSLLRPAGK